MLSLLGDAVTTAADTIAGQGVLGAVLIGVVAALIALWRRDVRRADDAVTRESQRAARAEDRADRAEQALADLNREVRTSVIPEITRAREQQAETVQVLRDTRRAG